MTNESLPPGRYKVFVNKTTRMYGAVYDEEICDCSAPMLLGIEATIEMLKEHATPESNVFRLKDPSQLDNYSLVEVKITLV